MFLITYFGYAAILIQFEKHILFDPGIIDSHPLVGVDQIKASYILVTHEPIEHFGNAVEFANQKGSILVGNNAVCEHARKAGIYGYAFTEIGIEQPMDIGANVRITGYNAPRGGFLAPKNTAFLVESEQGSVLHLGHPKTVRGLEEKKPDLLCIPVAGKSRGTLSPKKAVKATMSIHPRYAIPISGSETQTQEFLALLKRQESDVIPISLAPNQSFNLV
jgi:L-ascorbate metabolism protein UlaG (beta-lactamase superfamily)